MIAEKKKSGVRRDKRSRSDSPSAQKSKDEKSKERRQEYKKGKAKTKSKMSDRSLSSQQKSVTKGLSPPKETRSSDKKSSGRRNKSPSKSKKSSIETKPPEGSDHEIDATQWEFSRFKEEAGGTVNEDPNVYVKEQVGEGTPFLAEKKQKMLIRGEHLKQKPMYTLFFLFIQTIFALTVLITWSYFLEYNGVIPIILCYTNTIIILIVLLIVFVIQFARFNVVKEELDDDIRFRIPYDWKYWICVLHLLTFFLTCSNITIGALDNDFDGGAIAVVSGMPVLLILSAGHIFFALRPQG